MTSLHNQLTDDQLAKCIEHVKAIGARMRRDPEFAAKMREAHERAQRELVEYNLRHSR